MSDYLYMCLVLFVVSKILDSSELLSLPTRNGCRILSGMYQRRAAVWEGVEPPRGRGRLIGARETPLFVRSNQSNRVGYTGLIIMRRASEASLFFPWFSKEKKGSS